MQSRYTDSYRDSKTAKAAGALVTLSAHGWKIENEVIEARLWDSERRDSPYSTVADVEDEFCDTCGDDRSCDICREEV
jgi:hypothetical protein